MQGAGRRIENEVKKGNSSYGSRHQCFAQHLHAYETPITGAEVRFESIEELALQHNSAAVHDIGSLGPINVNGTLSPSRLSTVGKGEGTKDEGKRERERKAIFRPST